ADRLGDVDEQAEVDAVPPHERQLLEQLPAAAELAGERLYDRGEVGEQGGDDRPGHQLGRPAAAHLAVAGPLVEPLGEADLRVGQQRAEQADDEAGPDVGDVGVAPQHDVAARDVQRPPQRLTLAPGPGDLR